MMMDVGEIQRQYKYAKDRKKCVSILAELNCCSKEDIWRIVNPVADEKKQNTHAGWVPTVEQQSYMDRLDELDAMIKPLEDEYKRTADALKRTFECA